MKECKKKTLPLLIGFGMGCCHTCMPLHPCSVSFVRACPHPHSYALYAPAFVLVRLHLHSFAHICARVCACVHAHLYMPAYVLVCTCLRSRSFVRACICARSHPFVRTCDRAHSQVPAIVPVRKCLRSRSFVRAWIRPHPCPPCLSMPVVALVCPCRPRLYMTCVHASSLSLACIRPVLSFCLWNFTVKV